MLIIQLFFALVVVQIVLTTMLIMYLEAVCITAPRSVIGPPSQILFQEVVLLSVLLATSLSIQVKGVIQNAQTMNMQILLSEYALRIALFVHITTRQMLVLVSTNVQLLQLSPTNSIPITLVYILFQGILVAHQPIGQILTIHAHSFVQKDILLIKLNTYVLKHVLSAALLMKSIDYARVDVHLPQKNIVWI
jgi:hypothetical protein